MIDRRRSMDPDVLVRDYLARLDAASAGLSGNRRQELAAEVREHIDAAVVESGRRDEVTIRNILDRLGAPEEIVAAETGNGGPPAEAASDPAGPTTTSDRGWGPVEVAAVVLLCLAWPAIYLPFGPLLWLGLGITGLALVWLSGNWPTRRKVASTVCVVALYGLLLALTTPVTVQCTTGSPPQPCLPGGPAPTITGS
jgi:hypothetical protein